MPYLKEKTMNNRELKFRAWITPWGDDSQPYMKYIEDLQLHVYFGNWERGGYKDAVFQQYTGLKDSFGFDIYEGDIVRYSTANYSTDAPVVFSPFGHGFVLDSSGRHGIGDSKYGDYIPLLSSMIEDRKITYEVVGNIFKNKTNEQI